MKELKDLVAGDKVVVKNKVDGNTIIFVAKVERVTHRSIYACTVRFSRKNGRMMAMIGINCQQKELICI